MKPVYSKERELPLERKPVSNMNTPKVPVCPKCGVNMVLRTAKKGDKVGSQFWGCPNFPKCRATKLLSSE